MSRRRIITLAILAVLAMLVAIPPRHCDVFGYIPGNAIAVGYHPELRATWKRQLKHPVVRSVLAGYDVDADKAAREDGAFWTFLLAVGEDTASAVLPDGDGFICVAAASTTGRREPLLRLFWLLRWVPGLGRIRTSPEGIHFIDITDEDDPDAMTMILSVALHKGVLAAKLSDHPISLADMLEGAPRDNGLAAGMRASLPDGIRHRIVVRKGRIPFLGVGLDRDVTLDLTQPANAVMASASFEMNDADSTLKGIVANKLAGGNATADALAAAHAFAFALLPAQPVADIAIDALGCGEGKPSGGDAAIYLTSAPYGAQVFMFAIPAVTASIPGIYVNADTVKSSVRHILPKQLRSTLAVLGDDTICSSAASLNRQRHADPAPPFTWRDSFGRFRAQEPSAFLYVNCDPFIREFRQVAQALAMAATFSRDAVDPGTARTLKSISDALPMLSTDSRISLALSGDGDTCRMALAVECP